MKRLVWIGLLVGALFIGDSIAEGQIRILRALRGRIERQNTPTQRYVPRSPRPTKPKTKPTSKKTKVTTMDDYMGIPPYKDYLGI